MESTDAGQTDDIPDHLQIPQKLYGREEEISILNGAFDRVIRTGVPELALVSGYSGIGKSSLVRELQNPMSVERAFFASGKFDPFKRDIPYSTIVGAFTDLVLEILTGTEEAVAQWRREMQAALGINARLIVDLIPSVESVIGPQPPVSILPPTESQNRFRGVFRHFIGVFAQKNHPLSLFLDDLQWADPASLSLIRELMTNTETRYLFVLGAYRDNEVSPSHPLMVAVDDLRIVRVPITDVVLGPLSSYHLRSFLGDTLRCHPKDVAPLADLVAEKTAGNPFFAIQFLMALYDARLIDFDHEAGAWRWDIERIRARNFTDNVVEFLLEKLNRLAPDVLNDLKLIACLGTVVDAEAIAMVLDCPKEDVQARVSPAVGAGLIQRRAGGYGFVHYRVREAAYSLIKERKHAEERFSKVFHASPMPLAVWDLGDKTFADINASGCLLLGYNREEVLGRTPAALKVINDQQQLALYDSLMKWGKVSTSEIPILTGSGESRVVLASLERIELGGATCALASAVDITDRKRVEEERERLMAQLAEERAGLSAILNFMPVPMLMLEPDTAKTIFINNAARNLTGGTIPICKAEEGGKTVLLCTDVNGNPIPEGKFPIELAARGERIVDFEMNWQSPWGNRMLLVNSDMLRDQEGLPKTAVVVFQDLTTFKEVEAQLRQSQKMEALGRLSGGIAHDFNNLLTAINGYSSMALATLDANHPLDGFLREILRAGERATKLTRQLLAYSRKQVLDTKLWNLNAIILEMEPMLKRLIGEVVGLKIVLSPEAGLVKVDRGQMEQLLLNLVINSRDAMPQGGTLTVETANVTLDEHYKATHLEAIPGPYMMLAVSDTGKGMPPEVVARIFEPFFTTKEVGKGTGLGLSVVYGIVNQSGGTISVSSEVDKGTTFRIYLPLTADAAKAGAEGKGEGEEKAPAEAASFPGSETILLVEDESSVRKYSTLTLEAQGYRVYQAGNGEEALSILEGRDYAVHLVITDVVMPDMGGKELAARIGAKAPSIPILYISGYTGETIVGNGLLEPEANFLPKPFGPSDLARQVRSILDRQNAPLPGNR